MNRKGVSTRTRTRTRISSTAVIHPKGNLIYIDGRIENGIVIIN